MCANKVIYYIIILKGFFSFFFVSSKVVCIRKEYFMLLQFIKKKIIFKLSMNLFDVFFYIRMQTLMKMINIDVWRL